jgi:transcriptional regulator with XRE-family HTH domain
MAASRRPKSIHDPAYRRLAAMLREAREQAGLTQRALAHALGEHHTFVWKAENADRRIDAVELIRWCKACGASPSDIYTRLDKHVRTPKRRA